MRYIEFATASNFSFLRGASHPEELMMQAAELGLAGLGLCDRNSVFNFFFDFSVIKDYKGCLFRIGN